MVPVLLVTHSLSWVDEVLHAVTCGSGGVGAGHGADPYTQGNGSGDACVSLAGDGAADGWSLDSVTLVVGEGPRSVVDVLCCL